jgi:hypothetical protein
MKKSLAQLWKEHYEQLKRPTVRSNRPYAPNWSRISTQIRRATNNICCWCFFRKATKTHHLCYRDFWGKVYGREKGGKHGAGVCDRCHGLLHRKTVWHEGQDPDDDRNILSVALLLQFNYYFLVFVTRFWWVIALVAIARLAR